MVQILERVQAHYESREMPFATVYEWHPASLVLECECGEKVTLSATSSTTTTTCSGCGADLGTFVYDIREREAVCRTISPTPGSMMPGSAHNNTSMMRPLILKARAGVTTILRRPPTRSKQKEKNCLMRADKPSTRWHRRSSLGRRGPWPSEPENRSSRRLMPSLRPRPVAQLEELRCGAHQDEETRYWQANLLFERVSEQAGHPLHPTPGGSGCAVG